MSGRVLQNDDFVRRVIVAGGYLFIYLFSFQRNETFQFMKKTFYCTYNNVDAIPRSHIILIPLPGPPNDLTTPLVTPRYFYYVHLFSQLINN